MDGWVCGFPGHNRALAMAESLGRNATLELWAGLTTGLARDFWAFAFFRLAHLALCPAAYQE
jgi:hypothetical protein